MPEGTCSADDCDRFGELKRGMCGKHYLRWWKHGGSAPEPKRHTSNRRCLVGDCDRKHYARDMCAAHYLRWSKTGDPLPGKTITKSKGNDIGYTGAHARVKYVRGRAANYTCEDCAGVAETWAYDHADPNEQVGDDGHGSVMPYSTDPNHYRPLCAKCHKAFDKVTPLGG